MKKTSILSAAALALTVAAAPLAAEQVKPVEPTVSTQTALGTISGTAIAGIMAAALIIVSLDSSSSSQ